MMPRDLPPWPAVYQQTRRWLAAGVFEAMIHDLRVLLQLAAGRAPQPTAALLDSRTGQSTPESGRQDGYDGAKCRKGRKVHAAVGTLGHLRAILHVGRGGVQDRAQVERLAVAVQEATGETVEIAYVDQGHTGPEPAEVAAAHGLGLEVVTLPDAKRGFVLVPKRWVVERDFTWAARLRRLARDYERLDETLVGYQLLAFASLFLQRVIPLLFIL